MQSLTAIKLEKAKQLLLDVNILMQHSGYNSVISRLYYACYHATVALLLSKGLITKTHKGLIKTLHSEFVLTGLFDAEKSKFFSSLMQERMDEDYGDLLIFNHEDVEEYVLPAKEYVEYVEKLINKHEANDQQ